MERTIDSGIHKLLLEISKSINAEVVLEKLVQRITDISTEITNAEFGAFFYNTLGEEGKTYQLYTISGVAREAFSKFPMPRCTAIFHPTFNGLHTVRYSDVTQQPHFGKMAPHFGMPHGHLPVKSYLATPVKSATTGEVIGGLFLGHSQPGIFTEKSEMLVEGMAAQASIAMANAQLFEEKLRAEAKLKEQHEQYRSIFQATSDAMIIFCEDGNVLEANHAAHDLLDYSPVEITQLNANDLFPASLQLFTTIKSFVTAGKNFQSITRVKDRRGQTYDIKLQVSHYLHQGHLHLLAAVKLLEGDRRTEEALLKSENFAQTIANVSPVTLWMTDDKAETIYLNQTWYDMVGGSPQSQLGMGWLQAVAPQDRDRVQRALLTAFEQRKVYYCDFRLTKRDGSVIWCSTSGSPYYLQDGSFGGFAGSVTDISYRKKVEEELQRQITLVNTITNNTRQALFLMDHEQRCTYMNPAAEEMTGYKLQEVHDKPLHYYVHHTHPDGRHFPIDECPIDRALPTRMQTTGEEVFIRKNGEFFPVAFIASPIIENGVPRGTVIEVRETTEEKRIEEALRNKEKEAMALLEQKVKERTAELEKSNYELIQFTSVASHDLKEPIRKVSIFSQRAKELVGEVKNEQLHHFMDNIINSSRRMALLIDDLLSFARLSGSHIDHKPVDLNLVMEHIKDDLQLKIAETKATLETNKLPIVNGIALQLGQVMLNLVSNSLKFAHSGRPPVIQLRCVQSNVDHIFVYRDNGIGFDNQYADKIFDVFERLHTRTEYEGTGIGLAIVKKIINLHGGNITAKGFPGKGAEFVFTLPVAGMPAPQPPQPGGATVAPTPANSHHLPKDTTPAMGDSPL